MSHGKISDKRRWPGRRARSLLLGAIPLLALLVPALLPFPAATSSAAGFTSAEVARATLSVDCVDWRIKGICLRLKCGFFGCRVISVPWVEHRLPDLVVSSYNQPGETPWVEAGLLGKPLTGAANALSQSLLGAGLGGGHGASARQERTIAGREPTGNVRFKEVSIIGNPVSGIFRKWASDAYPVFCPTRVEPMRPYFQSELDLVSWRTGLTEQLYPQTWNPLARPIGTAGRAWANVYPRQGHVHQHHDVLAAAVAAQRAVDIATREDQPHVYQPVPGIQPSNERTDEWQMIYPRTEQRCESFGQDPDYWEGRENSSGASEGGYGWVYWPLHDCCPGPGRLISRIEF